MRCTLCTVHNHLQVRQIHRNCPHCMVDIFLSCVLAVLDPSNAGACRKFHTIHVVLNQGFDLILQSIRQLVAIAVKEFNAIKLHRVVGCRNHNTGFYLIFLGQISDRRSRNHAHINRICAYAADSCHQCICQHIARHSCVTANHNCRFVLVFTGQDICTCLPQLHRQKRRQLFICNTSYTVRSEHSRHDLFLLL